MLITQHTVTINTCVPSNHPVSCGKSVAYSKPSAKSEFWSGMTKPNSFVPRHLFTCGSYMVPRIPSTELRFIHIMFPSPKNHVLCSRLIQTAKLVFNSEKTILLMSSSSSFCPSCLDSIILSDSHVNLTPWTYGFHQATPRRPLIIPERGRLPVINLNFTKLPSKRSDFQNFAPHP